MAEAVRGAFFFNPSSGSGKNDELPALRDAVEQGRLDFIELTPEIDLYSTIRDRIARGQRLFVAAGGDGTINHVVQPVVNTDAVVAVVPMGTFNHFAKDLKVPLDWRAALDVALTGTTRQIDVARVNDRYFVNNISLGIYPEVVEQREKFRSLGKLKSYRYALVWALKKFPYVSLVVDAPPHHLQAIKTHVFMVSVNPYDLGQLGIMAPRTRLDGGQLTVYWMPQMPRIRFVKAIARYLRGKISIVDGLRSMRTLQLKVHASSAPLRLGMDGELFEMQLPLAITIVPTSLLVRVPRGA